MAGPGSSRQLPAALRLTSHFAACAAAAATAPGAAAAIVHSGTVNINIPSNTAGVYLNVVTGIFGGTPAQVAGWDMNLWNSTTLSYLSPNVPPGGTYVLGGGEGGLAPGNLPPGFTVSSASDFGSGNAATTGPFAHVLNSSANMIGFRFQNEATNATHYGFIRVALSGSLASQPRTIIEYLYEDQARVPITFIFPAPGALSLLVLGAAGLAQRRRQ
jgi:hypothetical protein